MTHGRPERGLSDAALAYAGLRLTFGVDMLVHGATRIASGPTRFATGLVAQFAPTVLPAALVRPFGVALPFVEAMLGVLLVLGLWTRAALVAGGLLMTVLVFGTGLQGRWDTVAVQLLYALVYAVLLAFRRHDTISLDGARSRPVGRAA